MPRLSVSQLRVNLILARQSFILREKSLTTTRTGSPMLRVVLADRTGSVAGVYFDVPGNIAGALVVGQGVEVNGRVGEFKDQLQINIERIIPARLANMEDFLPVARRPMAEMQAEFEQLLAGIKQADLVRLLSAIFTPERRAAFFQAPAAKFNHHACVGGLLEHTLAVVRLARAACELYPELDRDLAMTACLLHDLGKVRAYDATSFDMTTEGSLWGHLYIGTAEVEQAINALPGFDDNLRLRLVHALLAHHGKLENGSPVVPMTLEAIVLHYADNLDGDARGAIDQFGRSEGDSGAFTERSMMHDTRLYRGGEDASPSVRPEQRGLPF